MECLAMRNKVAFDFVGRLQAKYWHLCVGADLCVGPPMVAFGSKPGEHTGSPLQIIMIFYVMHKL